MAPRWSSQPFKAIYTIMFLLKTPPHLAILFLLYLYKPFRPLPERSARGNLRCTMGRLFFEFITATRSQRTLCKAPETAKDRHSKIEPADDSVYTGVLAASDAVKPGPVDAIWYPSPAPKDAAELKEQKVVLHFPGGAFVMAFGHQDVGLSVANVMAKSMKATRTVWAQYRLSGTPDTRFPAALQDALTFYQHVLSLGVNPKNIILSGDSAGGNVLIALLRHLEASQTQAEHLPLPAGAIVFSPWVNVTRNAAHDYEQFEFSNSDSLTSSVLQWGADSYIPDGDLSSEVKTYISPLHHHFKVSIPFFIHDGAAEAFHADIRTFAEEMAQLDGNRVKFHATPLASHDLLIVHESFGMTDELQTAIGEACEFFEHGN